MAHEMVIRTSEAGWFAALARAYKEQLSTLVIDDAQVGLNLSSDTLFDVGRKSKLEAREIVGAGVSIGMSVVGVGLLLAAIFDPEPTSKLTLLVSGGLVLVFTGGGAATYILTGKKPPNVKASKNGIEISWESEPT